MGIGLTQIHKYIFNNLSVNHQPHSRNWMGFFFFINIVMTKEEIKQFIDVWNRTRPPKPKTKDYVYDPVNHKWLKCMVATGQPRKKEFNDCPICKVELLKNNTKSHLAGNKCIKDLGTDPKYMEFPYTEHTPKEIKEHFGWTRKQYDWAKYKLNFKSSSSRGGSKRGWLIEKRLSALAEKHKDFPFHLHTNVEIQEKLGITSYSYLKLRHYMGFNARQPPRKRRAKI